MGKLMKKYLLVLLAGLAIVEVAYAAATKFTDLQCRNLTVTGTTVSTGNETHAGNMTVTGTIASSTISVVAVGGGVFVSTAAASTSKLCLAGSFATLPTSGYPMGCIAYQTSDKKAYVSTETVTVAGSWAALN
jgi:hypothetical protein